MTSQITDTFLFKGDEYSLIAMKGGNLATPEQFGMEASSYSTACYRGYFATYELINNLLFLREFALHEKDNNYLTIDGIIPNKKSNSDDLNYRIRCYKNLNLKILFTGKIRLAKDFIKEFYVHMGYQKATAFKTVLDFTLQGGQMIKVINRSLEMRRRRGEFKKRYESRDVYIDEAFNMDMDLV